MTLPKPLIHILRWVAAIVGAGLVWELIARTNPSVLPPLSSLYHTLTLPGPRKNPVARELPSDIAATSIRMLEGMALGFITGLAVGIPAAKSRIVRWLADPQITLLNTVPHIAVLPLLVIIFGFGALPVVLLVWSGVFVIVVINVRPAVQAIEATYLARFQVSRASRIRLLRHLLIPILIPSLMASARLAIGYAWALAILGETFGQNIGVGNLLIWYSQQAYLPGIFVAALLITAGAIVMEGAVRIAEGHLQQYGRRREAT